MSEEASLSTNWGPCQGIPGLSLVYYQPVKHDPLWRLYSGDNYHEMDVHKLVTNYSGISIVDCRWVVWSYWWWRIWAYPGALAGLSHNVCWLRSNSRHTYATKLGCVLTRFASIGMVVSCITLHFFSHLWDLSCILCGWEVSYWL